MLGDTLLSDIGGSMGPLYGTFFTDMAETLARSRRLRPRALRRPCCTPGSTPICGLGDAEGRRQDPGRRAGSPQRRAFDDAAGQGKDFAACLRAMKAAADTGCEATRDMVAKLGRAARLGERSRGFLDAGAASCCLLLNTLADGLLARLESGERA